MSAPDRIYHYTDRLSAADIRRDGVILAHPLILHRDVLARDEGKATVPMVCCTTSPVGDPTVVVKMRLGGWPMPPVGDLVRFALPIAHPHAVPFPEAVTEPIFGADPVWWQWTLATALMAGSHPGWWRQVLRDVPLADVIAIERYAAGGVWEGV